MLWSKERTYCEYPFSLEKELEEAILECKDVLFGKNRYYFDIKKKIGKKGKTNNIPDGYLLDLSDCDNPRIYVVENELSGHHALKHIAVQLLEFSLSFPSSKSKVKNILREEIKADDELYEEISKFINKNRYENIDYLLSSILDSDDSYRVLLIIDDYDEELKLVLQDRFNFPVEMIKFMRYRSKSNDVVYDFNSLDEEEIFEEIDSITVESDTIVVPARPEGFQDVFIDEDCWYSVRINNKMIPKIKYIAAYQVAPISAITHVAKVESIETYENTRKYIINFEEPAEEIQHVKLGKKKSKAPQSARYTNYEKLLNVENLDELF